MVLSHHPALSALQKLLSKGHVSGGTFAGHLPDPAEISSNERSKLFHEARKAATESTERDLVDFTGSDKSTPLEREDPGLRKWPEGYTGSFTNKGTVVLGAIVELGEIRAIGIDLELNQSGGDGLGRTLREDDSPENFDFEISNLAGFSVKEAVFKAYYRLERQDLHYTDVHLTWAQDSGELATGVAECPSDIEIDFKCTIQGDWIISVATW